MTSALLNEAPMQDELNSLHKTQMKINTGNPVEQILVTSLFSDSFICDEDEPLNF